MIKIKQDGYYIEKSYDLTDLINGDVTVLANDIYKLQFEKKIPRKSTVFKRADGSRNTLAILRVDLRNLSKIYDVGVEIFYY